MCVWVVLHALSVLFRETVPSTSWIVAGYFVVCRTGRWIGLIPVWTSVVLLMTQADDNVLSDV